MATKKIQFFHFNLVDQDATVITGGDENALFPASNLKDPRSTKVYRSNSASESVVFDFITVEAVDTIIIRGHLFDSFGFNGALTIKANATDGGWGSPAFSTTLTPNNEFNFGFKSLASAESYRFWRIEGVGSTFFELADIFIGEAFESSRSISRNFTFDNRDLSSFRRNRYGQKFVDEIADQRVISGNINLVTKDNIDEFFTFIDSVGKKKSFFFVLDESECIINDFERFSGRFSFNRKPVLRHVINGIYNTRVTMEEYL